MSEKRKARRAPSNFEAEYRLETGDQSIACQAIDISQGGIFLNITPPLPMDTRLYLMFTLPGFNQLGPLKVIGHVVRIVPQGEGQAPGVGVTFDVVYADNRDAIRAFIRNILGPTLVARPSAGPARTKPGAKYKLKLNGIGSLAETEADSEEDLKQLTRFNGFSSRGRPPAAGNAWMMYAILCGAALVAALVLWFSLH